MSAILGRQRPLVILPAQRPLSGAKRKLRTLEITNLKGRSRPLAEVHDAI